MKSEPEKTRIFVETTLKEGEVLTIPQKQEHYLLDVLRLKRGALISLFNGHDGEFVGKLQSAKKKNCSVQVEVRIRPQERTRDLTLLFAPVKKARLDFIAQKASELGVKTIWPVKTDYWKSVG